MGDWREKMGVFPSPPPHQRDWNNIKVLLKLFQKLATGCGGEEPPQANSAKRPEEVSKQGGRSIQWMDRVTAFAIL